MVRSGGNKQACRVVVVGNVALDADGDGWTPGGPSLYSALVLRSLGAAATVVSNLGHGYPSIPTLDITSAEDSDPPRFANSYDAGGHRSQRLLAAGCPISLDAIPRSEYDALIIAPSFHELDALLAPAGRDAVRAPLVAVALQGFLRDVDGSGAIIPRPGGPEMILRGLPSPAVVFFSDEDCADPEMFAADLAAGGHTVFLTRGERPVELFVRSDVRQLPTVPASPADPTGAGDCFAAACTLRLCEGAQLEEAGRFAAAAASLMIECRGFERLPTRETVEHRLRAAA